MFVVILTAAVLIVVASVASALWGNWMGHREAAEAVAEGLAWPGAGLPKWWTKEIELAKHRREMKRIRRGL